MKTFILTQKRHKYYFSAFLTKKLMLFIVVLSLLNTTMIFSQTLPLTFTQIPYSDPEINAPGRGVEQWNSTNLINVPAQGTNTPRHDAYYRFTWNKIETAEDTYNWSYLDGLFRNCIDASPRQKISFGIMTCYTDGDGKDGVLTYGDGFSAYPLYLHTQMQLETDKDWKTTGTGLTTGYGAWVPNWNSDYYLDRLEELNIAINSYINSATYNGVAYKDIVNSIDIRGYGNWGEWHSFGIIDVMSSYPLNRRPTVGTLKRIIDNHVTVFTDFPLSIMISTFDAERLQNTDNPKEIAAYALSKSNVWGLLGWRRDNWGALDEYIDDYLKDNTESYGTSGPFNAIINERWKYAPVTGEPPNGLPSLGGICAYDDLARQITEYHATTFGNGNFGTTTPPDCMKEYIRAASKAAGYRIILESGSLSSTITTGTAFSVTLDWKNIGIAPTYENWKVFFELKNSSDVTVWSGESQFTPSRKLNTDSFDPLLPNMPTSITDNFTLPTSITTGNYKLNFSSVLFKLKDFQLII